MQNAILYFICTIAVMWNDACISCIRSLWRKIQFTSTSFNKYSTKNKIKYCGYYYFNIYLYVPSIACLLLQWIYTTMSSAFRYSSNYFYNHWTASRLFVWLYLDVWQSIISIKVQVVPDLKGLQYPAVEPKDS
jgi:hypothetical protein